MPIENVLLDNVRINANVGMTVQDAKNVTFRDVEIVPQKGMALTMVNAVVKTEKVR